MAQLNRRVGTVFKYTQDVPSASWTVAHYLHGYPIVDVYVSYNGQMQKIIPSAVTYVDENTCIISFSTPYAGFAEVV